MFIHRARYRWVPAMLHDADANGDVNGSMSAIGAALALTLQMICLINHAYHDIDPMSHMHHEMSSKRHTGKHKHTT